MKGGYQVPIILCKIYKKEGYLWDYFIKKLVDFTKMAFYAGIVICGFIFWFCKMYRNVKICNLTSEFMVW